MGAKSRTPFVSKVAAMKPILSSQREPNVLGITPRPDRSAGVVPHERKCALGLRNVFVASFLFAVTVATAAPSFGADAIRWRSDADKAILESRRESRPVLLHFSMEGCAPCRLMEMNTLPDPDVVAASRGFVTIHATFEEHSHLAKRYGVEGFPSDVILGTEGQVLDSRLGAATPADYAEFLRRGFRIATSDDPEKLKQEFAEKDKKAAEAKVAAANAKSESTIAPVRPADERIAANGPAWLRGDTGPSSSKPSLMGTDRTPSSSGPGFGAELMADAGPAGDSLKRPGSSQPRDAAAEKPIGGPLTQSPEVAQASWSGGEQAFRPGSSSELTASEVKPGLAAWDESHLSRNRPPETSTVSAWSPASSEIALDAGGVAPQPRGSWDKSSPSHGANGAANPTEIQLVRLDSSAATGAEQPAMHGCCCVTLNTSGEWANGDERFGAWHRGRLYLFVDAAKRDQFLTKPDEFAPALGGYDLVEYVERGRWVEGDGANGMMDEKDRMFFFNDEANLTAFEQDSGPGGSRKYLQAFDRLMAGPSR